MSEEKSSNPTRDQLYGITLSSMIFKENIIKDYSLTQ